MWLVYQLKILSSLLRKIKFSTRNCIFKECTRIDRNSHFEGNNYVGEKTFIKNSNIGFGTYFAYSCDIRNTQIGKYCSIGPYTKTIIGTHPINMFISTHPSFYKKNNEINMSYVKKDKYIDTTKLTDGFDIVIENDVWIGANVTILGGVKIGNGSIVGANSLVNKDVPPFAVVAGNPARIIKYRFNQDVIDDLLSLSWWDKNDEWIKKHAEQFDNFDQIKGWITDEYIDSNYSKL